MEDRTAETSHSRDEEIEDVSQGENKASPPSSWSRNVDTSLTSIPIILCCFCSGLIDSCAFNAWGVFGTMQTGVSLHDFSG